MPEATLEDVANLVNRAKGNGFLENEIVKAFSPLSKATRKLTQDVEAMDNSIIRFTQNNNNTVRRIREVQNNSQVNFTQETSEVFEGLKNDIGKIADRAKDSESRQRTEFESEKPIDRLITLLAEQEQKRANGIQGIAAVVVGATKDGAGLLGKLFKAFAIAGVVGFGIFKFLQSILKDTFGDNNRQRGVFWDFLKAVTIQTLERVKSFTTILLKAFLPNIFTALDGFKDLVGSFAKKIGSSQISNVFTSALGKLFKGGLVVLKKLPIIGTIIGGYFAYQEFKRGNIIKGMLELLAGIAASVPLVGVPLAIAIDVFNTLYLNEEKDREITSKGVNIIKAFKSRVVELFNRVEDMPIIGGFIKLQKAGLSFITGNFSEGFEHMLMALSRFGLNGTVFSSIKDGFDFFKSFFGEGVENVKLSLTNNKYGKIIVNVVDKMIKGIAGIFTNIGETITTLMHSFKLGILQTLPDEFGIREKIAPLLFKNEGERNSILNRIDLENNTDRLRELNDKIQDLETKASEASDKEFLFFDSERTNLQQKIEKLEEEKTKVELENQMILNEIKMSLQEANQHHKVNTELNAVNATKPSGGGGTNVVSVSDNDTSVVEEFRSGAPFGNGGGGYKLQNPATWNSNP